MRKPRSERDKPFGSTIGNLLKVTALVQSGYVLEGLSDNYLQRNKLPEPYDLPDHIGNFKEGSLFTSAACGLIGMFVCLHARLDGTHEEFKKRAKITALAGVAVSSVIQIVGEKYGLNNVIGGHNTPDMIDAAYGIVWSGVTGAAAYTYAVNLDEGLRIARDREKAEYEEWRQSQADFSTLNEARLRSEAYAEAFRAALEADMNQSPVNPQAPPELT